MIREKFGNGPSAISGLPTGRQVQLKVSAIEFR
jgi:hypothetical protein